MKKVTGVLLMLSIVFSFIQLSTVEQAQAQVSSGCIILTYNLQFKSRDQWTAGQVSIAQRFLINRGYYISSATGYFGKETERAVKTFQYDNGISSTGNIGPITRQKIKDLTCTVVMPPPPSTTTYTVIASANSGGAVSPSGTVSVQQGGSQTYTVTPMTGYQIGSVIVNGSNVGAVSNYTFTNVMAAQTISATFTQIPVTLPINYTIAASAGIGGSISPSGSLSVTQGSSQTFTITPNSGYQISSVIVNDSNIGAVGSHTFTNINSSQTISASFTQIPIAPTPPPPTTATQPSGAQYGPYSRVSLADEFDGTTLNSVWDPHYLWWWGNKNMEFIPQNVTVENGMLRLKAQRDSSALSQGTGWTKASVNTYNGIERSRSTGFSFQYGFAEARVKVSPGQGLWPAFWAMPLIDVNRNPEIDFFEGLKDDSTSGYDTYMTLHPPGASQTQAHITLPNFTDGWHTIGFEWDSTHMTWFIDGVARKTVTGSMVVNQPMALILNLDVDCTGEVCWQKPTNANTSNPAYFDVDYVKVWQK